MTEKKNQPPIRESAVKFLRSNGYRHEADALEELRLKRLAEQKKETESGESRTLP